MERRDFLKLGGTAIAAGATAMRSGPSLDAQQSSPSGPLAAPKIETVRIGYVGIGGQGSGHVRNLLKIPGCRINNSPAPSNKASQMDCGATPLFSNSIVFALVSAAELEARVRLTLYLGVSG